LLCQVVSVSGLLLDNDSAVAGMTDKLADGEDFVHDDFMDRDIVWLELEVMKVSRKE
jgi:hypothetical protein